MVIFSKSFFKLAVIMGVSLWLMTSSAFSAELEDGLYARFNTTRGQILVELYYKQVPITCMNFVGLAQGTMLSNQGISKKYYDGLTFHRVIEDFMIQGGDPAGTGQGGPGYQFQDEFVKELRHDSPGILSMANSGPDTNGSQFFITHKATPWLDDKHTVFGKVIKGQDIVNKTEQGDKIITLDILRIGEDANAFKADKASFDAMIKQIHDQKRKKDLARFQSEMQIRYPAAAMTDSGLMYVVNKEGKGPCPKPGSKVVVHYTGMFKNNQVFDSSVKWDKPFEFYVGMGKVIKGWDIAVLTMKKGEKRTLLIPYSLAYGEKGYPGTIPPESDIIFEVELIDFQ
ncbi:MAG: peptidylprolyl isomerase [Proteobacteria bacterium]|nr:peptidylprolyl isomerase [Pseudomonadota bacterium]MBU1389695.1 peptidylprolyl isomerase [Pseudomonadota bacterium]MBU1542633.1 peptidylprolyl isomerase [Pseudomonadota bacterium]MBU2431683.1 peptidylprolyl isomerase [Pseudomonadota bacterium]MBU2479539.1 peptidylprolyl isomerase [Pseudomonadota bacterium]